MAAANERERTQPQLRQAHGCREEPGRRFLKTLLINVDRTVQWTLAALQRLVRRLILANSSCNGFLNLADGGVDGLVSGDTLACV